MEGDIRGKWHLVMGQRLEECWQPQERRFFLRASPWTQISVSTTEKESVRAAIGW